MRVILHVGAHKTGTTSIQATMTQSQEVLEQAGVIYPRCCWLDAGHHRLGYSMKKKPDPRHGDLPLLADELAQLSSALAASSAHTALISSEEMFTAPTAAITALAEALKGHDVEVVVFVRRPDVVFESAFNQRLKQVYRDFNEEANADYHIEDYTENPGLIIADIDYYRFVSRWAGPFGQASIRLVQYEKQDAVDAMAAILGIDRAQLASGASSENPRASEKLVAMLRLARSVGASIETQERLRDIAMTRFPSSAGAGLLDPTARRFILKKYRQGNEALFHAYLGQGNPYDPGQIDFGAEDDGGRETLRMRDLMRLVVELIEAQARDADANVAEVRDPAPSVAEESVPPAVQREDSSPRAVEVDPPIAESEEGAAPTAEIASRFLRWRRR